MPVAPLKNYKSPPMDSSGDIEFLNLTDAQRKAIEKEAAEFRRKSGDSRVGGGKKTAAKKPAAKKPAAKKPAAKKPAAKKPAAKKPAAKKK